MSLPGYVADWASPIYKSSGKAQERRFPKIMSTNISWKWNSANFQKFHQNNMTEELKSLTKVPVAPVIVILGRTEFKSTTKGGEAALKQERISEMLRKMTFPTNKSNYRSRNIFSLLAYIGKCHTNDLLRVNSNHNGKTAQLWDRMQKFEETNCLLCSARTSLTGLP